MTSQRTPVVGEHVLFFSLDTTRPVQARITKVWNASLVNIAGTSHEGKSIEATSVRLVDNLPLEMETPSRHYCCFPPATAPMFDAPASPTPAVSQSPTRSPAPAPAPAPATLIQPAIRGYRQLT